MSAFFSVGDPVLIKPTLTKTVASFLVSPGTAYGEAWLVARAGINNNGPLCVRLIDDVGQALSDWTETFSSSASRIKMSGVKIPAGAFPPLIRIEAINKSAAEHSDASVLGVFLVPSSETQRIHPDHSRWPRGAVV